MKLKFKFNYLLLIISIALIGLIIYFIYNGVNKDELYHQGGGQGVEVTPQPDTNLGEE
nr:hypothetical protein [Candidatus Gracilibacteria bacterium]